MFLNSLPEATRRWLADGRDEALPASPGNTASLEATLWGNGTDWTGVGAMRVG